MTLQELEKKIENNGETRQGVLTAEEYNTLLDAVQGQDAAINKLNADSNTVGSVDYKVNRFQWLVIE